MIDLDTVGPEPAAQRLTSTGHRWIGFAAVQRSVLVAPQVARRRFLRCLDLGKPRRLPRSLLQCFARWVLSVIREAAEKARLQRELASVEEWLDREAAAREGYELQEERPGDEGEPAYEPLGLELSWATAGASL